MLHGTGKIEWVVRTTNSDSPPRSRKKRKKTPLRSPFYCHNCLAFFFLSFFPSTLSLLFSNLPARSIANSLACCFFSFARLLALRFDLFFVAWAGAT